MLPVAPPRFPRFAGGEHAPLRSHDERGNAVERIAVIAGDEEIRLLDLGHCDRNKREEENERSETHDDQNSNSVTQIEQSPRPRPW
jgi:hypothetical protein